jgi:hypothetical protein
MTRPVKKKKDLEIRGWKNIELCECLNDKYVQGY